MNIYVFLLLLLGVVDVVVAARIMCGIIHGMEKKLYGKIVSHQHFLLFYYDYSECFYADRLPLRHGICLRLCHGCNVTELRPHVNDIMCFDFTIGLYYSLNYIPIFSVFLFHSLRVSLHQCYYFEISHNIYIVFA